MRICCTCCQIRWKPGAPNTRGNSTSCGVAFDATPAVWPVGMLELQAFPVLDFQWGGARDSQLPYAMQHFAYRKRLFGFAAHLRAFPCPLEAIHPAPPNAIATFRGYGSRPQDSDMQRSRLNACCLLRFGAERALVEALLSCYNKNTKAGAILL